MLMLLRIQIFWTCPTTIRIESVKLTLGYVLRNLLHQLWKSTSNQCLCPTQAYTWCRCLTWYVAWPAHRFETLYSPVPANRNWALIIPLNLKPAHTKCFHLRMLKYCMFQAAWDTYTVTHICILTRRSERVKSYTTLAWLILKPAKQKVFIWDAKKASSASAGILEQSVGASKRVGIGLSYRPARQLRLA